jgi:hypothetical protein
MHSDADKQGKQLFNFVIWWKIIYFCSIEELLIICDLHYHQTYLDL